MPKKLQENDYLYLTAYIHSLENRLLTRERTERMLEANTVAEAAKVLGECGYPELTELTPAAIDQVLAAARAELYSQLRGLVPDPGVLDVFSLKYDYHNAKVLIKAEAMHTDPQPLMIDAGRWPVVHLREGYAQQDLGHTSTIYAQAVAKARETLSHTGDPQAADLVLDRACYEELAQVAQAVHSAFLSRYVELLVDAANLRSAVRTLRIGRGPMFLKQVLLPGGSISVDALTQALNNTETLPRLYAGTALAPAAEIAGEVIAGGPLARFERLCDDAVMHEMAGARRKALGEEPVIGYLYAKDAEFTTIRIILTGRLAGLATDTIRERLRECYA